MAQWLSQQLKATEQLLETIDKNVSDVMSQGQDEMSNIYGSPNRLKVLSSKLGVDTSSSTPTTQRKHTTPEAREATSATQSPIAQTEQATSPNQNEGLAQSQLVQSSQDMVAEANQSQSADSLVEDSENDFRNPGEQTSNLPDNNDSYTIEQSNVQRKSESDKESTGEMGREVATSSDGKIGTEPENISNTVTNDSTQQYGAKQNIVQSDNGAVQISNDRAIEKDDTLSAQTTQEALPPKSQDQEAATSQQQAQILLQNVTKGISKGISNVRGSNSMSSVDNSSRDVEVSSSQREERLKKVCEKLQKRLKDVQEENRQLEELLANSETQTSGDASSINNLKQQLQQVKAQSAASAADMERAISQLREHTNRVESELEASQMKCGQLQEQFNSSQKELKAIVQRKEDLKGLEVEGLQQELLQVENKLALEVKSHASTRMQQNQRIEELEMQLQSTGTQLQEQHAKSLHLEETIASLKDQAQQHSQLSSGPSSPRPSSPSPAIKSQLATLASQVNAWKQHSTALQNTLDAATAAKSQVELQLKDLTDSYQSLSGSQDHSTKQHISNLEARLKEASETLYLKQTQLERMAEDKAITRLQFERDIAAVKKDSEVKRRRSVVGGKGAAGGGGTGCCRA